MLSIRPLENPMIHQKQLVNYPQMMTLILGIVMFSVPAYAQNFLAKIKRSDVSNIWTYDDYVDHDGNTVHRGQPLGLIGSDYQRFYIHFLSVIRDAKDPLRYYTYGKTRVKENVCNFQGVINIDSASSYPESDAPDIVEGYIKGNYHFFEDPDQPGSGVLDGTFVSYVYFRSDGTVVYDDLSLAADGYSNDEFTGTWTAYKSKASKICNWGDFRIPESEGLDEGSGLFMPNPKYDDMGWANYRIWASGSSDDPEVIKATQKEDEKWWVDNN